MVLGEFSFKVSLWLLDDFHVQNGATRIVPKTHLQGQLPQEALDDPWKAHPDQILIEAPAGTVVIFNSHAWHGGTTNQTDRPRRAIHSYFCRSDQPQQINQARYLRSETRERLSPAALEILGLS